MAVGGADPGWTGCGLQRNAGGGVDVTRDRGPSQQSVVDDGYLPLRALASYSGLGIRTLRSYLSHPVRPLPHYRVGGKILVKRSEFDAWLGKFRVEESPRVDAVVSEILSRL